MLTFADRLTFSARHRAVRALTQGVTRLARRARADRPIRWTCAAPAEIGETTLTRQLRWPWCGGYVSMARAAGIERIETSCSLLVPTCEAPAPIFTTAELPAALAA